MRRRRGLYCNRNMPEYRNALFRPLPVSRPSRPVRSPFCASLKRFFCYSRLLRAKQLSQLPGLELQRAQASRVHAVQRHLFCGQRTMSRSELFALQTAQSPGNKD